MVDREIAHLYKKFEVEHKPASGNFEEEIGKLLNKMKNREIMHEDAEFFYRSLEGNWTLTGTLSSEGEFKSVGGSIRTKGATRYLLSDTKWRAEYYVSKAHLEYRKEKPLEKVTEKIEGVPYRIKLFVYNKKQDLSLRIAKLKRHPARSKFARTKKSYVKRVKRRIPKRGRKVRRLELLYRKTFKRIIPTRTNLKKLILSRKRSRKTPRISNKSSKKRFIPNMPKLKIFNKLKRKRS